jgi:two-component sensor histidine kinase
MQVDYPGDMALCIYCGRWLPAKWGVNQQSLINNCIKHAFCGFAIDDYKNIRISMKISDDNVILSVKDNGVGIHTDLEKISSLGMTIIKKLVEHEFKGRINIDVNEGTEVKIVLPKGRVFSTFIY